MVSPINTAISGLFAASRRLSVSANNIVNQGSTRTQVDGVETNTPYTPKQVVQISQATGGVITRVIDKNPATVGVFIPDHPDADAEGVVQFPNVDIAEELVNQKIASYDYKANLKTIKVQDELQKSLLDIFS